MEPPIKGTTAAGFERVRDVFASLWDDVEVGSSFCAYVHGEKVVDLWGGWLDRELTDPWREDTLINVYSTTKGLASAALAVLWDEGRLDYNERVATYWPEFAQAGKENVTVAQLLSHQAGLCGVETKLTVDDLYDWDRMTSLLAAQKPLWEPGTAAGYHAVTWGYFPGELVRRITGQTLGEYLHEKLAGPLGADAYIGLPASELSRCGAMIGPNHARKQGQTAAVEMPALYRIALANPSIHPFRDASSDQWRQAEIAAANGQANARGIATLYAPFANGGELNGRRYVSPAAIAEATRLEVDEQEDVVLGRAMRRARGFLLASRNPDGFIGSDRQPRPALTAFGHAGAGGSTGFADPEHGVAIGYAMNQMQNDITATPRSRLLLEAVYACLP